VISDLEAHELLEFQAEDSQLLETIIQRIYVDLLERGDVCVDGGANLGLHALPLARIVGPEGRVFAFEPVPSIAERLEACLAARGLANVVVSRKALFHTNREITFTFVRNAPSRSGIERTTYPFDPDIEELEVRTVRLDEALEGVSALRFCKLELEGAEFRALQGAEGVLRRHAPAVVFERSLGAPGWYGYTPEEFFDFFSRIDYLVFDLFGRQLTPATWGNPGRPWYAIGVRAGSDDERLVRERLPQILRGLLDTYRHPIDESAAPPVGEEPFVWAAPNPVPAGAGSGATVVHWDTGDRSLGEVYVSVDHGEERLFYSGVAGSRRAPWINTWSTYEFRLYAGRDRSSMLAAVTVTRRKG
jgi:FkbM family methyltransferase